MRTSTTMMMSWLVVPLLRMISATCNAGRGGEV